MSRRCDCCGARESAWLAGSLATLPAVHRPTRLDDIIAVARAIGTLSPDDAPDFPAITEAVRRRGPGVWSLARIRRALQNGLGIEAFARLQRERCAWSAADTWRVRSRDLWRV